MSTDTADPSEGRSLRRDHDIRAALGAEHDQDIIAVREALFAKLGQTLTALAQAHAHLKDLRGDQVYDVEFAEGSDGADIEHLLDDARRLIHGAAGIALRVAVA